MKIEVSEEDYNFLKDLQNELNTQKTDGNAQPVYWGVMESREVGVPDGCGDPRVYMGDGDYGSTEDAVERIDEIIGYMSEDAQQLWSEIDKNNMTTIVTFAKEYLDWWEWRVVYIGTEQKLTEDTGAFFTKRACKDYIDHNKHNLENPRTYAMTALRNKEFERVVNILRTMRLV